MTQVPSSRRMPFRPTRRGVTLKRWRLENFKSVRAAEVELLPLTVVVGANSAGKSTLLQSIRAASQAAGTSGYLYPLNGRGVRLGTVSEVVFRGRRDCPSCGEPLAVEDGHCKECGVPVDELRTIVLGADFDFLDPRGQLRPDLPPRRSDTLATLSWEVELGVSAQQQGVAKIERLSVRLEPSGSSDTDAGSAQPLQRALLTANVADEADRTPPTDDADEVRSPQHFAGQFSGSDEGLLDVVDIHVVGGFPLEASVLRSTSEVLFDTWRDSLLRRSAYQRGDTQYERLPEGESLKDVVQYLSEVHERVSGAELDYARAVRMVLGPVGGRDRATIDLNLASSESFRHEVLKQLAPRTGGNEVPYPHNLEDLGPVSDTASDFLRTGIRYLGPLREEPRAAYPDSPEGDDTYVGSKGEFTASVLQRHGRRRVQVPAPDGKVRSLQFINAVNRWADYLDIGQSFSVSDQGRFGIQMQVRQKDVDGELDLTSVGTGVSQLLPVIVMCLQAPVGSLLLIEQPELHLNPRVQQRLTDFLLAIAQSGRHLIVETHSEYLISRLRRRVAEDEKDSLQDTIGIYFAKRVNGATTFDLVQQNEYGGIEEWPENFFDQATEEEHAILSAAVKKRRAKAARSE